MRKSREATAEGRDLIVQTGARMIRERGIEGTSVAEVMAAAGRTHGGFYRHFQTKDALVQACLDAAFDQMLTVIADPPPAEGRRGFEAFARFYLSDDHLLNPGFGCPAAALSSEIAWAPDGTRAVFTRGMDRMIAAVAETLDVGPADREVEATRRLILLIGAMSTARAVDAPLALALRKAALDSVLAA
ncbi:TetR/AcrR family transcriptional regulator [Brevundimonas aurifodinae]|uniref:TetR/AcrR family transcriptional regulator n=2 Tax=Brevundimonas TaxID=41275 RepID=A0ABV1NRJ0_9CAUL|nr:MAG: hypothetical protein B7Z42_13915 [Brevundimonas sp. 12-68-7]OYX33693.1 MAG: hypothetical protein B7Z01_08030 [Brevundimonas subvibrioides]